tara:strand:- start:103 stop:399 length:297 start_codon:yes stop_codon:yes gene_type:complete
MIDRIENIKEGKYAANITEILTVIGEWDKLKPTETTKRLLRAAIEISFYVNNIQVDLMAHRQVQSEYRADKLRAVERARKAEERVEELQITLKSTLNL